MLRPIGMVFSFIGLLLTLDILGLGGHRPSLGLLGVLGPPLLFLGLLLSMGSMFPKATLAVGLVMLGLGVAYPIFVLWPQANEGSGMFGTLLFLLVGLPGLVTTVVGLFWVLSGRDKD